MKFDEDEWEKVEVPESERGSKRLDSVVSVRFSPDEVRALRAAAEKRGETLSLLVRQAALRERRPMVSPAPDDLIWMEMASDDVVTAATTDFQLLEFGEHAVDAIQHYGFRDRTISTERELADDIAR